MHLWKTSCLLSLAWLLVVDPGLALVVPGQSVTEAKSPPPPKRYSFTIDPKTPLADLFPLPPEFPPALLPWLVDDLAKAPEILFQKIVPLPDEPQPANFTRLSPEEQGAYFERLRVGRDKGVEKTAHGLAKINHLNKSGTDQFLKELLKTRPDLRGLPFVMGAACRTDKAVSKAFIETTSQVRGAMRVADRDEKADKDKKRDAASEAKQFWDSYTMSLDVAPHAVDSKELPGSPAKVHARIAALMQMLAPQPTEQRQGLVKYLASLRHPEAAKALTRLAVFSIEPEVRDAAVAALTATKELQADDELLLEGVRYPWPAVAQNASAAIVKLNRKGLLAKLVDVLDEPDSRAPIIKTGKTAVVREVVRINHHHNCLLCHAPGNTKDAEIDDFGGSEIAATGAVAIPGQTLPRPSFGYNRSSPDILVRVDVNYLRQDFSLMQPVTDTAPWPEMQRFDFLVRTREVTAEDVEAYKAWLLKQGPEYVPSNHGAALVALRALTGRDEGSTAIAWRRSLKEDD